MKFAQNIPDAPIGFSNKDISVTPGIYTALAQKFKKKKINRLDAYLRKKTG